ncbi:universal stress protein [Microbacterium sp. SSW1-49]|uniref:Universal stress protein n=1 Tax=Microbacterium croceum TaxID=2851645 RepID=A0ABT0FGA2_9MICO|nr:universal stress protein [Microbacterium croceum]MCK2036781.1 universal stress protein [Microbacterium croceum]
MPARYVLGLKGVEAEDAATTWADSRGAEAGVPVVHVHVTAGDDAAHDRLNPATRIDAVLPRGPVAEELARFVHDDDVLVISTGKTGFVHSRIFGTTGLRIAAAVRCPVAVIPQVDLRFRSGIIAGVKNDDLLETVIRVASEEASQTGAPLQIVHSSFSGVVPAPADTRPTAMERARTLIERLAPQATLRIRESARPPAEALLDASRNAALLVVGAGRGHRTGQGLGPVVQDILLNINAPVIVVPARPSASSS